MKKVVVDRYIIVVGVMNVTRQSSSKNMNEHCLSNMDMNTMFRIQMGRAGGERERDSCCSALRYSLIVWKI
jgi:hypothetical protein